MGRTRWTRRRYLSVAGVTAFAGLAGCGSGSEEAPDQTQETDTHRDDQPGSQGDTGIPAYATAIPALDGNEIVFTAYDLGAAEGHLLTNPRTVRPDPLRYNPIYSGVAARVLGTYVPSVDPEFPVEHLGLKQVSRYLGIAGVGVGIMPVDVSGVLADVDEQAVEVELAASDRAVVVGPSGDVFGVTENLFAAAPGGDATGFDAVDRVRAIVDARAGAGQRLHETDEAFAHLLRAGDTTGAVSGAYSPDRSVHRLVAETSIPDEIAPYRALTEGFGAARGALFHLTVPDGERPHASALITYEEATDVDVSELLAHVGHAAASRSVTRAGRVVQVEGRYDWDALADRRMHQP